MTYDINEMRFFKQTINKNKKAFKFAEETSMTREEKIAFLDEMSDGIVSYILDLGNKYQQAIDSNEIKKDSWGYPKMNSLNAWLKRNDSKKICYNDGDILANRHNSTYNCMADTPMRNITRINQKGTWESGDYDDIVEAYFAKVIRKLAVIERENALKDSEYFKQMTKFKGLHFENPLHCNFGLELCIKNNKTVYIEANGKRRYLTEQEIKYILDLDDELQKVYNNAVRELTEKRKSAFGFDKPMGEMPSDEIIEMLEN